VAITTKRPITLYSLLDQIEAAFAALGKRLHVEAHHAA
jgi:hypothetical protein